MVEVTSPWEFISNDGRRTQNIHYSIIGLRNEEDGMAALRRLFADAGEIDEMNLVLFSTSGVHGSYLTIEEAYDEGQPVTFLVVHPRTVTLRYGNVWMFNKDDRDCLVSLREASREVIATIGAPRG